ncbi:MAG: molybdopterin converting factor small subunit [Verrucomicrobiales bacterium]|jgi:molybdopterin converting factor small subunit
MPIQLNYRGQLALAASSPSEEIDPPAGATIADLIKQAATRHGADFAKLILAADGTFRSTLLVALDGEQIQNPAETQLPETAKELTLLPPIAGG